MNEKEAVDKMRDLQSSIETSMGYSRSGSKFPVLFLLTLCGILGTLVLFLVWDFYNYFSISTDLTSVPIGSGSSVSVSAIVLLMWIIIAAIFYNILARAYRSTPTGKWDRDLDEGITGIIKIIENEDWDETLMGLRKAKLSFVFLGVMQFVLYWALAAIVFSLVFYFVAGALFGVGYSNLFISGISAIIVLGLGDSSIKKSYRQLWYMDGLIAELRWFYLEFQGSEL